MAASFPSSIKSFATRTVGQVIGASWFNDLHDEVVAIEAELLTTGPRTVNYAWPSADGTVGQALTTDGALTLSWASIAANVHAICNGRLTLTSGTPVTITDVTGATSVYFCPYGGSHIGLYDGSSVWTVLSFTEKTLALGTLTSGLPYDVFAYSNAGVVALEALAWTNGTTRATALTLQNGVLVKTGATTRRYLGTFYTTATTTTEDSEAKRLLFNYYNRRPRPLKRLESTASWNYTTATIRQANAAAANQVAIMVGYAEDAVDVAVHELSLNGAGSIVTATGIGEDSTSTFTMPAIDRLAAGADNSETMHHARLVKIPTVGYHFYSWNEWSQASGTTTWYGSTTLTIAVQYGLQGMWFA